MPQIPVSMASLKAAMDIQPARTVTSARDVAAVSSIRSVEPAQKGPDESFERDLAKAESRPDSKAVDQRPDASRTKPDKRESKPAEPDTKDDRNPVAGAAAVTSSQTTPEDSQAKPESTQLVQPTNTKAAPAVTQAAVPSAPIEGRAVIMALLLDAMPVASAGEQLPASSADPTAAEVSNGPPLFAPPVFRLPIANLSDQLIQLNMPVEASGSAPTVDAVPTTVQPDRIAITVDQPVMDFRGAGPETAQPAVRGTPETIRSAPQTVPTGPATPETAARPLPGPEWTGVLEFTRLLNPRVESQPTGQQAQKTEPEPAWSPRPRPEIPRVYRDDLTPKSEQTRPATESPAKQATTDMWSVSTYRPQVTPLASSDKSPGMAFRPIYRPIFDLGTEQAPANVAGPESSPVVQTGKSGPGSETLQTVSPEKLVSDVREAVIKLNADGRTEARLVLNPPELGELIVRLESAKNGTLRASFHTMSPLVRESLEAGLPKLTEALKSEGLTLSQAEVHLDFNLGPQGHPGESNPDRSGQSASQSFDAEMAVDSGNTGSVFERLPDGATISILA